MAFLTTGRKCLQKKLTRSWTGPCTVIKETVKQLSQNQWDAVTNRDSTKFKKE
ncbi:Hypothetical protein Tpal_2759 [Trichococcus palustris]|uniref:Uncharacterized protein n=1 Tax=Trichococcus palustris TaxID=140314 RepID=A0A143YZL7_9LACT|nr:Hypothetical protein Tpal_2759 [Trichococcus palustris]SFL13423.1 hypothetical protein SAMN04488076_12315 [Trichococcus palustris]